MSYPLIDIPAFDTATIIDNFNELLLEKSFLDGYHDAYTLYVIADGALEEEIDINLEIYQPNYTSLYPEHYSQEAGYAQPFLIDLGSSEEFREWFMQTGYGNSKGIFLLSTLTIETLREKIQAFCIGHIEEGNQETFFRFYDPKIFPAFLRILSENQLQQLFAEDTLYFSENFITTERIDMYRFKDTTKDVYKSSCLLTDEESFENLLEQKPYTTIKDAAFYQSNQTQLLFDVQDIALLTQSKLYIHTKRSVFSLQKQYEASRKIDFKTLYKLCFDIAQRGYTLGLIDSETNYQWIIANHIHTDIEQLKSHKVYGTIFDNSGEVTQTQKALLLEELIETLEENIITNKENEDV